MVAINGKNKKDHSKYKSKLLKSLIYYVQSIFQKGSLFCLTEYFMPESITYKTFIAEY